MAKYQPFCRISWVMSYTLHSRWGAPKKCRLNIVPLPSAVSAESLLARLISLELYPHPPQRAGALNSAGKVSGLAYTGPTIIQEAPDCCCGGGVEGRR